MGCPIKCPTILAKRNSKTFVKSSYITISCHDINICLAFKKDPAKSSNASPYIHNFPSKISHDPKKKKTLIFPMEFPNRCSHDVQPQNFHREFSKDTTWWWDLRWMQLWWSLWPLPSTWLGTLERTSGGCSGENLLENLAKIWRKSGVNLAEDGDFVWFS